jgi:hypothetical protein
MATDPLARLEATDPRVSKTNQDKGQCSDKIFREAFSTTTIVKQRKCAERTQEGDFAHYAPRGYPLLIFSRRNRPEISAHLF